jgi:hypothetical protein
LPYDRGANLKKQRADQKNALEQNAVSDFPHRYWNEKDMKIYPQDTFEIDSTLSASEIFSALEAVVEPPKWFRWRSANGKQYQGEFSCTVEG